MRRGHLRIRVGMRGIDQKDYSDFHVRKLA